MKHSPNPQSAIRDPQSLLPLVLVCGLYVAARLWRLTESCLWFDEVFGVHAARHAWGGLWGFVAADLIHPPLFYALLKVWVAAGGESVLWLRLFPVAAACAAVAPFLLLARELRLRRGEALLALLVAGSSGFLIKYAQEVRMYSLLLFFTLTSLWLFARYLNDASRRRLLALAVVNLLLVYTHYYGWLVVASEALFLLRPAARAGRKGFGLSVVVVALCFAPWVYACVRASGEGGGLAQNVGWIARPGPADAAQFLTLVHEPFYFQRSSDQRPTTRAAAVAVLLLVALPVVALLLKRDGEEDDDESRRDGAVGFLLFFALAPPALAFAASWVLPHSVWGARHLVVAAAPALLLWGVALARLRPRWLKTTALVLLVCWLAVAAAFALFRREGAYVWCAWEGLAASAARDEPGTTDASEVYAFEDLVAYHLWFALEGDERFRVRVVRGLPGVAEDPAYFLPRRFDGVAAADANAPAADALWLAFRAPSLDETRPPLNSFVGRGYRVGRVYERAAQGQRAFLVRLRKTND
jgi:4-amino-4-deoxy-L-arabinose transferase-like glycosyltransferase